MLGLLEPVDDVAALAGCDLVIEAVFEDLAVKHDLFGRIEAVVAPETVLATNTSALSVTRDRRRARAGRSASSGCTSSTPRRCCRSSRSIRGQLTVGRSVRHGLRVRGADRQGSDRLRRHARLRRQPDPDPGPQRRGARARGGNGEPGGHRQGHAARHRLADRAARADRPDRDRRPRPRLRGTLEGVPRAQVRAAAPARADDARQGCSAARAARASTATTADDGDSGHRRQTLVRRYDSTDVDPRPRAADVVAPHRRQQVRPQQRLPADAVPDHPVRVGRDRLRDDRTLRRAHAPDRGPQRPAATSQARP